MQRTNYQQLRFYIIMGMLVSLPAHLTAQTIMATTSKTPERFNNNVATGRVARAWQYHPKNGLLVSENGHNRFTRALYGSYTDFRLETSDSPIFALYKSKNYRNLSLALDGQPLDQTTYCEASYGHGCRSYTLRHKGWGKDATLRIECVMSPSKEEAYIRLQPTGLSSSTHSLQTTISHIRNSRIRRNGDLGADPADAFEPLLGDTSAITISGPLTDCVYIMARALEGKDAGYDVQILSEASHPAYRYVATAFASASQYNDVLQSHFSVTTPDPLFNTLPSTLPFAADGIWDGSTWLHGAIGWRMPLAGWRAAYVGDVLGWNDRAKSHFDAYAASQVTDVPATIPSPSQDSLLNLARAEKRWGTQMYSNGYICRNPNRNNQMHHYDMNLNYIDELLWHFQYDADTAYMRKMWPVITSHLAWEKRNYDPDGNHLYDAYCCIWASDALYYNGGEVSHSTAYNYRGNRLAARIAELIGEDPTPYASEAEAIRNAMNERLWFTPSADDPVYRSSSDYTGHWAEYRDGMGLKRLHPSAALWSIYTPIDCGVGSSAQAYSAAQYVNRYIPHLPLMAKSEHGDMLVGQLVSTTSWLPYSWSINNVASAEMMHTALALFQAGADGEGFALLKANLTDQMLLGRSPGNYSQISYMDAARGESYRDFGDNVGISSRAIVQGLFGIVPQALYGKCSIRPGFLQQWDSVSVSLPYLSYTYKRHGNKGVMKVSQRFTKPLDISVIVNGDGGHTTTYVGSADSVQVIEFDIPKRTVTVATHQDEAPVLSPTLESYARSNVKSEFKTQVPVYISTGFNASVTDIFKPQYFSPRPQQTTLQIPVQGVGEWCHPKQTHEINDSVFRTKIHGGIITLDGVRFYSPAQGPNIAFASLWHAYPDKVALPVSKPQKAGEAAILLAGSTNHMQSRVVNAIIRACYTDGTVDTLALCPPYNYCPIEQDYFEDDMAFYVSGTRPKCVPFSLGEVADQQWIDSHISPTEVYGREIKGGAAQLLYMPLNPHKKVRQFELQAQSNDIVVGIMGITLRK